MTKDFVLEKMISLLLKLWLKVVGIERLKRWGGYIPFEKRKKKK